jgi:ABC-2 type transport system permease protein
MLLGKDVLVLRRSPLIVGVLIVYPIVIALLLGLALSRGPEKPRVAIYNALPDQSETLEVGGTEVDPRDYAKELFKSVDPINVDSREQAIAKVEDGDALAAIIVPEDLLTSLQSLVALNSGKRPQVEVIYNGSDPLKRQFVESTIKSRVADLNAAVADKLTKVAAGYIELLLRGGEFKLLGQSFDVVGLERSKRAIDRVAKTLPEGSRRRQLDAVSRFAGLAASNLDLSTSILDSVGTPIKVKKTELSGSSAAPLDAYAVSVAVTMSLMLIGVLLAAGLLAMEREENTLSRLLRGLMSPWSVVASKVLLAAACAGATGLLLTGGISIFFSLDWARLPFWLLAFGLGGLACAGFGVGLGALARDVRAASLIAILVALPLTFLALVPEGAVAMWLYDAIRAISAVFPFRPALFAVDGALNSADGMWLALLHLVVVAGAWSTVGRMALRRMGQ